MTFESSCLTGDLIRAARALARLRLEDLAADTALGVATLKRAEASRGPTRLTEANARRILEAFAARGVEFIAADSSGGVGVRFRSPDQADEVGSDIGA